MPDQTNPTPAATDPEEALRRFFGSIWVMRVQVQLSGQVRDGDEIALENMVDVIDATDPAKELLAFTRDEDLAGRDLGWQAVRAQFADGTPPPAAYEATSEELLAMDGAQFARWIAGATIDLAVGLALLDVLLPPAPMAYLRTRLARRTWYPSEAELDAGQRFALDYLSVTMDPRIDAYLDELHAPVTDATLQEPKLR